VFSVNYGLGLGAVFGLARGVLPVSADEWPVGRPTIWAVTFKRTAQSRIQTVVANDRSQSAALARVSAPPHGGFEPKGDDPHESPRLEPTRNRKPFFIEPHCSALR